MSWNERSFPPDEGNKNIFSISDTLTSCKVHIVSRKCLRLQIPMSFGQAGVLAYAATGLLLVTRRKRSRCTLAASLSHVPTRRHIPLALVPSLSRGRLVQVACNHGSHDFVAKLQLDYTVCSEPVPFPKRWCYTSPTFVISISIISGDNTYVSTYIYSYIVLLSLIYYTSN